MAFDEGLAERVREQLIDRSDVVEKRMFGGLAFMISGHMCCGIVNDSLMARVGPDQYSECLTQEHVSEMDFTGRPLKRMIYVAAEGVESDINLEHWINRCLKFVLSLPPK